VGNFGYSNQILSLGEIPRPGLQPAPSTKTIPFDYVFQLELLGIPGNKVQDVVQISMEGVFVALSVGYSLAQDESKKPRFFAPVVTQPRTPTAPALVPIFQPGAGDLDALNIIGDPGAEVEVLLLSSVPFPQATKNKPTVTSVSPPNSVGRGRIGPDGKATIATHLVNRQIICVWDRTNDLLGQLFQVGPPSTPMIGPDPLTGRLPVAGDTVVHVYGQPALGSPVVLTVLSNASASQVFETDPEDLAIDTQTFPGQTTGSIAVQIADPTPIPLQPGDVLFVNSVRAVVARGLQVPFSLYVVPGSKSISNITLGEIEAGLERAGSDLTGGFRLSANAGSLRDADLRLDRISGATLERTFETGLVAAEETSFLYSLDVSGTGREYQNKAIHNIAGLGIANGDRPFRPFAKPVMFEPRSSIRIQVEEISGPAGTLFIVLQGYKMLGTGRIPA
jgi:hypothetical protein